jgi:hypothetical protein
VGLAVLAGGALGGVARSITDGMFVQYFKPIFLYIKTGFFKFISV